MAIEGAARMKKGLSVRNDAMLFVTGATIR